MKYFILLLLAMTGIAFSPSPNYARNGFIGIISDKESVTPLDACTVTAFLDGKSIAQTTTDAEGNYALDVPVGNYTLEIAKFGYETQRVYNSPVTAGRHTLWSTALRDAVLTHESVTVLYHPQPEAVFTSTMRLARIPGDAASWLYIRVIDTLLEEELIGASVKVLQQGVFVRGAITDVSGNAQILVSPGKYTIEVSYTGYETFTLDSIDLVKYSEVHLVVPMKSGTPLREVLLNDFNVSLVKEDVTSGGKTLTSDQIKNLPTRSVNAISATTAGESAAPAKPRKAKAASESSAPKASAPKPMPSSTESVKIRGAREEKGTNYYIDGIRVTGATPPFEKETLDIKSEMADDKELMPPPPPGQPAPKAGLLTAGEWNDLDNWSKHWTDILADGETDQHQQTYLMYPKNRYSVLLLNEQNFPLMDIPVVLTTSSGEIVWEARTDNTGKAELWDGFFNHKSAGSSLFLSTRMDGKNESLGQAVPFEKGINRHTISRPCGHSPLVDIVWAVDATGSMGDEINYLKTELYDVIGRVKNINPDLRVRMGTVFYRDETDEYLVKSSGLSPDIAQTIEYIRDQNAGGGGDYPEAVHTALEEAIFRQNWSDNAVARICFLLLDASPHQNPEVNASLQKSIREAARRGIRIVPVTASGIQKDTEFLMKFMGMATNGSYTFLTDHSGIGGKHLEPTTDEYKVEALNNLLVRIITQYTAVPTCDGKSLVLFEREGDHQQIEGVKATFFPNPAVDHVTLQLPFDAEKVTIYNSEGQAVHSLASVSTGTHTIPLTNIAAGYYLIRIWKGNQVQSGKLLVVGM